MSKNIVLCLDGTWNDQSDENKLTNVALLDRMCVNDGQRQIAYYDKGVGTDGWYDGKLGGVHGVGLSQNIREAYLYLVQNYKDNDKVYIFGFSRGAFTARSLAGFLYRCGLPPHGNATMDEVEAVYDAYKEKDDAKMAAYKSSHNACPIEMLGVWDTVGALGIPISLLKDESSKLFNFHDTKLSPEVKFACHAVAIDERRESFEPTLWDETPETRGRMKQVWFSGVHSDVGGGYPERHHSDVALKWMVEQARQCGLLLGQENDDQYQIDLGKAIHESAYRILGVEIGIKTRQAPVTRGSIPKIHQSVLEKMKLLDSYKPQALEGHITDANTLAPYEVVP